jgi:polar amino acid transport system permease protein
MELSLSANDWLLLLQGLGMTLLLTVGALPVALGLGTVLAVLRFEGPAWLRWGAVGYIEALRSIPLLLFLFFMHYGILPLMGIRPHFVVSSLITFMLFEAAYLAEILRAGLQALHREEREAAISLGLSRWQQLVLILLPLAYQRSLPALINQLVTLIKDTSLTSIVGVIELTRAGEIIYQRTYEPVGILLLQAGVYFGLCFGLSRLSRRLETRPDSVWTQPVG